jgi:dTDP-4-dehydrorhamnose reductase
MKVLVTGAGGQVGQELQRAPWPEGTELAAYTHRDFDIADGRAVAKMIAQPLDLVINAAAYTAVDRAESERDAASRINGEGPGLLARRCTTEHVPLIHLSTDYVFDGSKEAPYVEDDATQPLNHYGSSKREGEKAVRAGLDQHVILRTASVFSEFGANFVKTMLRLGAERRSLQVVSDQTSSPTAAMDIAEAIVHLADEIVHRGRPELWGTYHFCGQPPVTWMEFAQAIFESARRFGRPAPELLSIRAEQYPAAAKRPAFSVMDCRRIQQVLGIRAPLWAARLPMTVAAILGQKGAV